MKELMEYISSDYTVVYIANISIYLDMKEDHI
jgi:hypothetical protein